MNIIDWIKSAYVIIASPSSRKTGGFCVVLFRQMCYTTEYSMTNQRELAYETYIKMGGNTMLTVGMKGTMERMVTDQNTAAFMLTTPAMIALMEHTSRRIVQEHLAEGQTTVGTRVDIRHVSASPVGMQVRCESELIKVDGRALTFSVKCFDDAGLIGEGEHDRFIIDKERFQAKADAKLEK